jgi:5-methylcytosine-specific restriction endonuclease McrA
MDTDKLTLHHVVFRSQQGGHEAENLVTLCWNDHRLVHDGIIEVFRREGEWYFSDTRDWRTTP